METKYISIEQFGPVCRMTEKTIEMSPEPSLSELNRIVLPELLMDDNPEPVLERVRVWHGGRYLDMFADEESKKKGLPVNVEATKFYHANILVHEHGDPVDPAVIARITADWPVVYGNAVLFLRRVWF